MRIFLKFLKWAGITLGVLFVLFIGINAFDEKLDPGAAAILNSPPKVKPEDNAFFYWAGMHTALSNGPSEFGEKCVTAQRKVAESGIVINDLKSIPECHEQNLLESVEDKSIVCEWRKQPCLKRYFEQHATIQSLAGKNQGVMARYGMLLKFKQFDDVHYYHPNTIFPNTYPPRLYPAISAARLQEGDTSEFIRRTQDETRFYRVILSGESSLLSKMLGTAWLERSARLVSEAVHSDPQLAMQNQTELSEITRPLNVAERSLGTTMESEFRYTSSVLLLAAPENVSLLERWLSRLTLKQNATENYYHQEMSVWRDLSQLPTEQYLAAEKRALEQSNPWRDGYLHLVYNPMGKILAGIGTTAYASYPRRIIDTDGLLRLVSLQIQIAAQKIPESEIPAFLKKAAPKFHDPYTGQPMQWDKTRGLYFHGYGKRITDKDGFVSVKL